MQVPHPIPDVIVDQVAHRLAVLAQPLRIRMIERLELEGQMSVQARPWPTRSTPRSRTSRATSRSCTRAGWSVGARAGARCGTDWRTRRRWPSWTTSGRSSSTVSAGSQRPSTASSWIKQPAELPADASWRSEIRRGMHREAPAFRARRRSVDGGQLRPNDQRTNSIAGRRHYRQRRARE